MATNDFWEWQPAGPVEAVTICSEAPNCHVKHCEHRKPVMTKNMLNLNGRCAERGIDITILPAETDDPNVAFKMRNKNG